MEREKPWVWGYLHRGEGGRRGDNPFPEGTGRREWFRGWDDRDAIEKLGRQLRGHRRRRKPS